jgi:uncharacterized protein
MKCPICQKQATKEHKPFCSQRCAEVDLGRWLTENYAIPKPAEDEDDEES